MNRNRSKEQMKKMRAPEMLSYNEIHEIHRFRLFKKTETRSRKANYLVLFRFFVIKWFEIEIPLEECRLCSREGITRHLIYFVYTYVS